MTRGEIRTALDAIERCKGDSEAAHSMEDDLRAEFLGALADGCVIDTDISELAALVLTSANIKFARWCA